MTRSYKQLAGPGGIECVAAIIEGQKRLTKALCYKECPGKLKVFFILYVFQVVYNTFFKFAQIYTIS